MSASRTPTWRPSLANATATLAAMDDLPTPPLPEAIMKTGTPRPMDVSGARDWAMARAASMTAALAAASITPSSTRTSLTPSRPRSDSRTSRSMGPRSGQAAVVRATSTWTTPPTR